MVQVVLSAGSLLSVRYMILLHFIWKKKKLQIWFFAKKYSRAFSTFRGYFHKYLRYSLIFVDVVDIYWTL